jgi:predicted enzyme related to lactoylglutathione lyase
METPRFGIIIKVNDLEICRHFYRDILELGDPAADSSFAVEFRLSSGFTLRLEKSAAEYLEHESAAVSWMLETGDIEKLRERMDYAGHVLSTEKEEHSGGRYYRGVDPEKNYFWVAERKRG